MSYQFPQLKIADIIDSLRELCGLHLQDSSFTKPDSLEWQMVFTKLICEVTGCTEDSLKQPLLSYEFEYPDLHQDAVPAMNLIAAMQKLMPALCLEDFNGGDVIFPTTARLRKICSAIINFLRYKHSRQEVYFTIKQEVEKERDHYNTIQKANNELRDRIQQRRQKRTQQEAEIAKVQEETNKLSLQMQEHQKTKQAITKTISELKTKTLDNKAKADHLKCEILKRQEEEDRRSLRIVQSPEKVRTEQERLTQQLEELKENLERRQQRLREIQREGKEVKITMDNCEKGMQLLSHIQDSVDKESELENEVMELADKMHMAQEQVRELNVQSEQHREMLALRQEKLTKLSVLHQNKVKAIEEQTARYKEEKENLVQQRSCDSEMKDQLVKYRKGMEESVCATQQSTDHSLHAMSNMYGKVLENTDKYNRMIGGKWESMKKALQQ